jgi:hypothetical protein
MNTDFAADALDDAIALQKIRAYCESVLTDRKTMGASSDHEAGYLTGKETACYAVMDIIEGVA